MAFRGTLGRITTVGQVPLALDAYRWFLVTISPFPVFQQYTLLLNAAYGLPQLHNILAHSNHRPFAGNREGQEFGADEDVMTGDLLYPNPLYPTDITRQAYFLFSFHLLTEKGDTSRISLHCPPSREQLARLNKEKTGILRATKIK